MSNRHPGARARDALGAAVLAFAGAATAQDGASLPEPLRLGWTVLREMDCARCHGRDYRGLSGPSLVAAVRDGPRERFDRFLLDGEIVRGMPGYRSQPRVADNVDAIYAYLRWRAGAP